MKKSLLILLTLSLTLIVNAQETVKQQEVGLIFQSLSNFGLTYKVGTEKSLWRYQVLFLSGNSSKSDSEDQLNENTNLGFGIRFGKEFRKSIAPNLELRFGADLSFNFNQSKSNRENKNISGFDRKSEQTTYRPGIYFVFGLNYVFKEKLIFGVELLPGVSYFTGTQKEQNGNSEEEVTDISGINYGFSNGFASLSLGYRF